MNNFKKINDRKLGKKLTEKIEEIGMNIPICNVEVKFGPLGMSITGGIHSFGAGFMCHEHGVSYEDFKKLYRETFGRAADEFSERFANLAKEQGVIVDASNIFEDCKEDDLCS